MTAVQIKKYMTLKNDLVNLLTWQDYLKQTKPKMCMKSPNVGNNDLGQFMQSAVWSMMLHSSDGAEYHPIMLFIVETWHFVGGYLVHFWMIWARQTAWAWPLLSVAILFNQVSDVTFVFWCNQRPYRPRQVSSALRVLITARSGFRLSPFPLSCKPAIISLDTTSTQLQWNCFQAIICLFLLVCWLCVCYFMPMWE